MKRLPEEFNLGEQSPLHRTHRPPHTQSDETGQGEVLAGEPSPRQEFSWQGVDHVGSQWYRTGLVSHAQVADDNPGKGGERVTYLNAPLVERPRQKDNGMSSMGSMEQAPLWSAASGPQRESTGIHKQHLEGATWKNVSHTREAWRSLMRRPPVSLFHFSINWLLLYFLEYWSAMDYRLGAGRWEAPSTPRIKVCMNNFYIMLAKILICLLSSLKLVEY